jgi:hypothetical protein
MKPSKERRISKINRRKTMVVEWTDDEEEMAERLKNAFKDVQGSSAYSWSRNRPYNGQPHTDNGKRGATILEGITMRDIVDCFVGGALDCCGIEQPELYALRDRPIHDLVYKIDFSHIDPMAHAKNMLCRIEKMMGIYPNVDGLMPQNEEQGNG